MATVEGLRNQKCPTEGDRRQAPSARLQRLFSASSTFATCGISVSDRMQIREEEREPVEKRGRERHIHGDTAPQASLFLPGVCSLPSPLPAGGGAHARTSTPGHRCWIPAAV
uniref:Uncharacterized protein n=1 Tax=Knipowitschia caucasica TaxID=637954 RepID=A0AAV2LWR6_KNICA